MLEIVVLSTLLVSWVWLYASYLKTQRALQWWSQRQSIQQADEAEKIRDSLLQESFSIRRSLEQSLAENDELLGDRGQKWLASIEHFHQSLAQLSDRLSPPHTEYSLPLAVQWLIDWWQTSNPRLAVETELPLDWQDESPDRSQVVLRTLNELLRVTSSELATKTSIQIRLEQKGDMSELIFYISFPNESTLKSYSDLQELKYLTQAFRFLTSGQCFWRRKELTEALYFRWRFSQ